MKDKGTGMYFGCEKQKSVGREDYIQSFTAFSNALKIRWLSYVKNAPKKKKVARKIARRLKECGGKGVERKDLDFHDLQTVINTFMTLYGCIQ